MDGTSCSFRAVLCAVALIGCTDSATSSAVGGANGGNDSPITGAGAGATSGAGGMGVAGSQGEPTAGAIAQPTAGAAAGASSGGMDGTLAGTGGGLGGSGAEGGGDASVVDDAGTPDAGPTVRTPVFKQTRCIDPTEAEPGVEINFPCDGIDIWVVMPEACTRKPCGVLFNIHGGGMSDHATMDQATNMIALGIAADYIVVHPHKGTWSVASDYEQVFGFMQQVVEAFDADEKRVHSTGYSQGGQISWALACKHSDVIASIAPTEEINRVTDCWKTSAVPTREIPILFAYGKRDSIGGGYAAAQTLAGQVAEAHDMTGPETIAGTASSTYFRQRWVSPAGTPLEFISQDYSSTGVAGILAGHCLPMSGGDTFVSCSLPVDYDWGEEVVEFFKAHPLP